MDTSQKYCIIGAGSSGLAAARNLKAHAIPFDVLEYEDDIGGNWYYGTAHSRVYRSAHTISSKPLTEYPDFPMPKTYPDFPHHRLIWQYLRDYARHFDLYPHIQFNMGVEHIAPNDATSTTSLWTVRLSNGETRIYKGLIIANGHNWDPCYPNYPGEFDGTIVHSADYKTPDIFVGKCVLVVGAGNSGCDIAVEAAQNAEKTFQSMRRAYHYIPKWALGRPVDQWGELLLKLRVPLLLRRLAMWIVLLVFYGGTLRRYGLRSPDHKLFQTHPIINQQMVYYVGQGDIIPKPDVYKLDGRRVWFKDGISEEIDVIVYATGYLISFPFVDDVVLQWRDLYLNIFHRTFDNLFVIGLIQPASGQFGLVHYQSALVAEFIHAQEHAPAKAVRFRQQKQSEHIKLNGGIRYLEANRHLVEVDHFSYRNHLKKRLKQFR